jgi:uncharacterized protein YcbK (DUF882 family)
MISLKELNPHNLSTTSEIDSNLLELLGKINIIRLRYGQPLTVTSGLRSEKLQEHLIEEGLSNAPSSKHLTGQAVDIFDQHNNLKNWVMNNIPLIEEVDLYMEDFGHTKDWVHFQTVPPKSGRRFFIP